MSEQEVLEQELLNSPAARARVLAEAFESLERDGHDLSDPRFAPLLNAGIADGAGFLS